MEMMNEMLVVTGLKGRWQRSEDFGGGGISGLRIGSHITNIYLNLLFTFLQYVINSTVQKKKKKGEHDKNI